MTEWPTGVAPSRPAVPTRFPTLLAGWLERDAADRGVVLDDLRVGVDVHPTRIVHPPVVPSRDAAILVPVFDDNGLHVVLIERASDIGTNRGEIAFPGGKLDPGESGRVAALREADEEVGIAPAEVEIVASLSTHPTFTGYVIWPYVGLLAGRPALTHESREVARSIVVALDDLLADGAWWQQPWRGGTHLINHFAVADKVAWGATGDVLAELLEICIAGRLARTERSES